MRPQPGRASWGARARRAGRERRRPLLSPRGRGPPPPSGRKPGPPALQRGQLRPRGAPRGLESGLHSGGGRGQGRPRSRVGPCGEARALASSPRRRRSAESDRWRIEHFSSGVIFVDQCKPQPRPLASTPGGGAPPRELALTAPASRPCVPAPRAERRGAQGARAGRGGGGRAGWGAGPSGSLQAVEAPQGGGRPRGGRSWSSDLPPFQGALLAGDPVLHPQACDWCQPQVQQLFLRFCDTSPSSLARAPFSSPEPARHSSPQHLRGDNKYLEKGFQKA